MKNPQFTIITVCYNAEEFIADTIKSVLIQTFTDYEYIIKDGNSSDSTLDIINSILDQNERIRIASTSDDGIFDAMNMAVDMAKGDFIFFLNAGDYFYDNSVLQKVSSFIKLNPKPQIVYGNIILQNNKIRRERKYAAICSKSIYAISGDCICHQAIFAKRGLLLEKKFCLDYKVCADRDWQFGLIKGKKKFMYMNIIVAVFKEEGFSTSHIDEYEKESLRCVEDNYNKFIILGYKIIARMRRNRVLRKALRMFGELLFQKSI